MPAGTRTAAQKKADRKYDAKRQGRSRNWTLIVYPDSAPEHWRSILDDEHLAWVESPLHDKDINPGSEEDKKAHWHVLIIFECVKSYEQVKALADKLNAPHPQPCNPIGIVRYMIHLDHPDKYQYSREDIIAHGNITVEHFFKPNDYQKATMVAEMLDYISANNITFLSDFIDYCRTERFDDWFIAINTGGIYILKEYIKSKAYKSQM